MIYTSESRALCTAEIAVHIPLGISPEAYLMMSVNIPEDILITEVEMTSLPIEWKKFPFIDLTRKLGDEFILENRFAVMKVPSAVIPGDYNYLFNTRHPDFEGIKIIKIEPYEFDERFFKR